MELNDIKQKKFENLTYDDLYYLFITLNYTKSAIADMFKVNKKDVDEALKKNNIKMYMGPIDKVIKCVVTDLPNKNGIILTVDYDKEQNNVHIGTCGASGAIYDVNKNNIARDIGFAVECYIQDYVKAGEL